MVDTFGSAKAAARRLRDLGVDEDILARLMAIQPALERVRKYAAVSIGGKPPIRARNLKRRNEAIIRALELGAPREDVVQAAGLTEAQLRTIWWASGRTGVPWRDTPVLFLSNGGAGGPDAE